MARLLGGEIDLASIAGEGSTFTVELPLDVETRGAVPRSR
jgi:signal transduction histidine kinase